MSTDHVKDPKPIRLVFELARADHPRLYDELIQFHKGTKRVNRRRVLAYDEMCIRDRSRAVSSFERRRAGSPRGQTRPRAACNACAKDGGNRGMASGAGRVLCWPWRASGSAQR